MKKYCKPFFIVSVTALLSWFTMHQLLDYFLYKGIILSVSIQNQKQTQQFWRILEQHYPHDLKIVEKPYPIKTGGEKSITQLDNQRLAILKQASSTQDLKALKVASKPWLIINFWGTWCPPCVRELPLLNQFYEKYLNQITQNNQNNQNVQINQVKQNQVNHSLLMLGISFEDPVKIKNFLIEQQQKKQLIISFPLLITSSSAILEKINAQNYLPLTILVNPAGKIIDRHIGEMNQKTLNQWQKIINNK